MNRIKINIPVAFTFSTVLSVRITDINYGGHVGNDTFLSLIHEARQQFLRSNGYSELNIGGIGLIMADAVLEFKTELVYGDQVKISVAAADFDKLGFDLYYQLELISGNETHLAGRAKTGMMCFDYSLKKKMPVPEEVIAKLSGL